MELRLHELVVTRGARQFTDPISRVFAAGSLVAITGANGSGKSTLLDHVAGLLPTTGLITFDGRSLASLSLRERSRTLAYLEQSWESAFDVPVRTVVEWGTHPHRDVSVVAESVHMCGCHHLLEQPLSTLSGGERARVGLARAYAQCVPVLLLDEPTAAVDRAGRHEIGDLLRSWAHQGKTIVTVTHDAAILQRADQIVDLDTVARL